MSSQDALERAREELRARQGTGARYDAENAPAQELAWAREGTAFFARKLGELPDDALREPSRLSPWTRAEVIAHVGHNARALTRLVEWARTGVETPMYLTDRQRNGEILLGGTLPARALRNLFAHSEVHLNVEWRDLEDDEWDHEVRTAQGRLVPVRETAWMRTREVWVHAVDLRNGATFAEFPVSLIDRLIADVVSAWNRRDEDVSLRIDLLDRGEPIVLGGTGPAVTVTGLTSDIAAWMCGRGGRRVRSSTGDLPKIPRWF